MGKFVTSIIALFLGPQNTSHMQGGNLLNHHQCAASTWMMRRQNAHHTPAYWWRGDRFMKSITVKLQVAQAYFP